MGWGGVWWVTGDDARAAELRSICRLWAATALLFERVWSTRREKGGASVRGCEGRLLSAWPGCRGHGAAALRASGWLGLRRPMPRLGQCSEGPWGSGWVRPKLCAGREQSEDSAAWARSGRGHGHAQGEGAWALVDTGGFGCACAWLRARTGGLGHAARCWLGGQGPGAAQSTRCGMPAPWSPRHPGPGCPWVCLALSSS